MPRAPAKAPARRRDAEDNRARLIAAAREVFASLGFEAPLGAIASRAGVGRATLYRNFPDRFALAGAIFDDNLRALEALAKEAPEQPGALLRLLAAVVEHQVEAHALVPAILSAQPSSPELRALVRRTKRLLREPLRRARAAGEVRDDLTVGDLVDVLGMVSAVVAGDASVSSRRRRAGRALDLVVRGLEPRP